MKYPQLVSSSTPASLQDWLEEELESRGIDGVYTRYILSLLQQDTVDLDPLECEHLSPNSKHLQQVGLSRKENEKSKNHRGRSWERQLKGDLCNCSKPVLADAERRKKTAAVECLRSASEQKNGIETLIDEVCTKLKHIHAANAKEALQLINSSPQLCLKHSNILESSLQEQAEKYYAAFPALSGKHEPLAKLYQQQEMWTVWDGRKISASVNEEEASSEVVPDDFLASDAESDSSEKENRNDTLSGTNKMQDSEKTFQVNSKSSPPSFIVPKMKIPVHKVANLSMYSPFTSSAYQVGKTINNDCKLEYYTERKIFGGLKSASLEDELRQQLTVAALPKKLIMETDTWEILSSLGTSTLFGKPANDNEYRDNLTDLASKFDSNLASIWARADVEAAEDPGMSEELELSLQILSIRTPPSSHDLTNGENENTSVWAVSLEDFKNMKLQEQCGGSFQLTSVISVPNLLQSLASHDSPLPPSSPPTLDLGNVIGSKEMEAALSPEMKNEEFDDVESILFACPDTLFSASSNESPSSSEYSSISPSELLTRDAQRIYHLWEENEHTDGSNIWASSNNVDKVVSWISSQCSNDAASISLKVNEGWKMLFPPACSPSKENCTITHHKGESRFVEVIPSSKNSRYPKAANVESSSTCNSLSIEDGENLLTSPKTHFQPIHQDSSEGESIADEVDLSCEEAAGTPIPEDSLPGSPTPEILSPPPGFKRSLSSSSLDELVGLAELSGLFNKDSEGTRDTAILEMITKGWKPELLEDKSTSTESPVFPTVSNLLSFREDKIWSSSSIEEGSIPEIGLPWKWSTTDDASDLWLLPHIGKDDELEDDIFEDTKAGFLPDGALRDYNVKALRKELEEEEEELFRDINCLSDGGVEAGGQERLGCQRSTYPEKQKQGTPFMKKISSCFKTESWETNGQALKDGDYHSEAENNERKKSEDSSSSFPMVPVDKVLYSSELEDEWIKTSEPFDVQVPKRIKSKAKSLCQKRPCTFYLEGNCRRSDCKFSHDLASITCRFWEEGSCFKGITCPFLHGYISDIHPCEEDAPSHKFALESESDFPSLSKSGNTASTCVKAAFKSTGRIIRPKKKRQSTMEVHKRLENLDPTTI